jgi:hypothetical protein
LLEAIERYEDPDQVPPKFRAAGVVLVETVWRSRSG